MIRKSNVIKTENNREIEVTLYKNGSAEITASECDHRTQAVDTVLTQAEVRALCRALGAGQSSWFKDSDGDEWEVYEGRIYLGVGSVPIEGTLDQVNREYGPLIPRDDNPTIKKAWIVQLPNGTYYTYRAPVPTPGEAALFEDEESATWLANESNMHLRSLGAHDVGWKACPVEVTTTVRRLASPN